MQPAKRAPRHSSSSSGTNLSRYAADARRSSNDVKRITGGDVCQSLPSKSAKFANSSAVSSSFAAVVSSVVGASSSVVLSGAFSAAASSSAGGASSCESALLSALLSSAAGEEGASSGASTFGEAPSSDVFSGSQAGLVASGTSGLPLSSGTSVASSSSARKRTTVQPLGSTSTRVWTPSKSVWCGAGVAPGRATVRRTARPLEWSTAKSSAKSWRVADETRFPSTPTIISPTLSSTAAGDPLRVSTTAK
mmetsp:Transcript_24484/g.75629  ORF Transcript_24484/g.75629 Transcript_24484/m.75629 type:complete len:250 (+) Transcript_24484:700-1449(+)